ncbi:redoxin family protein [Empedobacter brevis]|uniref:redoxin family protein n=1 Tax=Empedobacter brevis TaxID=247 RepID=UPI0039B04C86
MKIIVFTPSLYKTNSYASMMTTSLNYYFVKNLAFTSQNSPKIDVIYVVNEEDKWSKEMPQSFAFNENSNQNKLDGTTVIYDAAGKIYKSVGLKPFNQNTISSIIPTHNAGNVLVESSVLFLVDQNNKILMRDNDYRAQGEHLKPLERLVKRALKTDEIKIDFVKNKTLKVGDKAPDFILNGPNYKNNSTEKFLDDKSSFKVLTFYPAAFSGQILPDFTSIDTKSAMTCAAQIQLIDHNPLLENVKSYAVSSSTNPLLELWKSALRTNKITYLNDENYAISLAYNSYNNLGYNNRATYVIDKNGIIVYANPDLTFEDEAKFPTILEKLILNNQ